MIDTLRSAARHGAMVLNYTELHEAEGDSSVWRCGVRDLLGGAEFEVKARSVVNAAGPWAAEIPHSRLRLRLTKGVHLVIDGARSPIFRRLCGGIPADAGARSAIVMTAGDRILFAIPWGERVILGTTDTDYSGPIEDVAADENDVAYILEIVNRHFPAALTAADVIRTWAGVRPLIASEHGGPSDISRAHQILMPEPGWFDVAGGKLTTYRRIAEQVIDRIVSHNGCDAGPCRTAVEPLLTAGPDPAWSGILPPPIHPKLVEHYCRHEWAVHLDDVMVRRAGWHYYHGDAATIDAHAAQVAAWMAAVHGWDAAREAEEVASYSRSLLPKGADELKSIHGQEVRPPPPPAKGIACRGENPRDGTRPSRATSNTAEERPAPAGRLAGRGVVLAICGLLVLGTALVFVQTARYKFVNCDNNEYVYENTAIQRGPTWQCAWWAITNPHSANWHPLTWLSHALDWRLFGRWNADLDRYVQSWPGGHHLVNLGIHAVCVVLLYLLLQAMTGATWPSAAVAAAFAIHPLHVESAAWATGRKDTLSAVVLPLDAGRLLCLRDARILLVAVCPGRRQLRPGPDGQADAGNGSVCHVAA